MGQPSRFDLWLGKHCTCTLYQELIHMEQCVHCSLYCSHKTTILLQRSETKEALTRREKHQDIPASHQIFVGGLPEDTTEVELQQLFSAFGTIVEIRLAVYTEIGQTAIFSIFFFFFFFFFSINALQSKSKA